MSVNRLIEHLGRSHGVRMKFIQDIIDSDDKDGEFTEDDVYDNDDEVEILTDKYEILKNNIYRVREHVVRAETHISEKILDDLAELVNLKDRTATYLRQNPITFDASLKALDDVDTKILGQKKLYNVASGQLGELIPKSVEALGVLFKNRQNIRSTNFNGLLNQSHALSISLNSSLL
jgi:hypothetical protein